jgi:hypothetical protein
MDRKRLFPGRRRITATAVDEVMWHERVTIFASACHFNRPWIGGSYNTRRI